MKLSQKDKWEPGEFSKTTVVYCLRMLTILIVWAMVMSTFAMVFERTLTIEETLTFGAGTFGGELLFLLVKRILAKEKVNENASHDSESGQFESDHQCTDISSWNADYGVSDPSSEEEDEGERL